MAKVLQFKGSKMLHPLKFITRIRCNLSETVTNVVLLNNKFQNTIRRQMEVNCSVKNHAEDPSLIFYPKLSKDFSPFFGLSHIWLKIG